MIHRLVERFRAAVEDANARWAESTGIVEPPLCANEWQLVNHCAKWAHDEGLIDRIVYKGEAARLLADLDPAAKREVWGEALWYLDETLPERWLPIPKAIPETGGEFVAWLRRVESAAGGRIIELMRNWACRRKYCRPVAGTSWPDLDSALWQMQEWSPSTVADAYAEARRIMTSTDGMDLEIGDTGEVRATVPDHMLNFEESLPL